ncbi:3',5'-cyclic-nucleotide phosphodiesterase [Skermanella stibiiresistens SB22]|uniref:3',5'-cyclic-nucleotide phosphodiesterase n=1 Tax=Skermanella stibiiresistens SB22 TaxID=1385369 RepID=W9GZF7_9PROT|nr:metallophosphoesterase [Skermanella stibiiresistens]EWY39174.1 3',5'-cyclic-nucleotide phosphodiesterase [Skermanella stibiiresistens SB22]
MKRTVAHISDLHFGRIDPMVVEALVEDLTEQKPSLAIISGDLTQRARRGQFEDARAFLDRLTMPYMVIPGNHDIPNFNLFGRFTDPYRNYKRYISEDLCPVHQDDDLVVVGVNTVRPWILDFAEGRISRSQIKNMHRTLRDAGPERFKIFFTHHPFLPPPDAPETTLVGRARLALRRLEDAGVDLMLAGHLHKAYNGDIMSHHTKVARSILVAQASTATSTRLRNEPNAYNFITIDGHGDDATVTFLVRSWEGARFTPGLRSSYVKKKDRWELQAQDPGLRPLA